jgi:hypothetical protein
MIENEIVSIPVVNTDVTPIVPQEQVIENVVKDSADNYEFANMILVKPLDVVKVFKTLTTPEDSGEKDEEGAPIMHMVIKQVETDSLLRKGTVVSIPYSITVTSDSNKWMPISIGDIVVFPDKRSIDFDLVEGTALIPLYEVLAKGI